MDHNIHAKFERTLQVRGHESVITDNTRAGPMRYFRHLAQIGNYHHRVSRRFNEDHSCIGLDCCFYVQRVRGIYEIKFNFVIREHAREEPKCASVSVIGNHYMLAGLNEAERGIDRGHSRGKSKSKTRAFESSE